MFWLSDVSIIVEMCKISMEYSLPELIYSKRIFERQAQLC